MAQQRRQPLSGGGLRRRALFQLPPDDGQGGDGDAGQIGVPFVKLRPGALVDEAAHRLEKVDGRRMAGHCACSMSPMRSISASLVRRPITARSTDLSAPEA